LPRIEDDGTEAKDLLIIFVFSRGPLRVHFALRFSYPVIAIQIHFIKKKFSNFVCIIYRFIYLDDLFTHILMCLS